jgi:hypothetical protein
MHVRPAVLAVAVLAIAATALLTFAPTATAQVGEPGTNGHGACTLAPGAEPCVEMGSIGLDTFLMDRASRLVMAATRWQPRLAARPVALTRTGPAVARPRASH